VGEDLAVLQAEFPAFRIWEEQMPGRVRYVARSRTDGINPHTVITADLEELRIALQPSPAASSGQRTVCATEPNIARIYAYWLQGKDHYAADRAAASRILEQFPEVAEVARANRAFVTRAVRYLADQGITQLIDIGSGLPASPNVHETARSITPGARVVYVDLDPVVLAHARALLAIDDNVTVVAGDVRDPARLLRAVAGTGVIDSIRPTGVLLTSLLHFLTAAEADTAVAMLREWAAPGSYLVISAGTSTGTDPELIRLLQDIYGDTAPVTGRAETEIAAWFEGLTLVDPGLVDAWAWRPDTWRRPATARARFLAGVGYKASDTVPWAP
jgi:O-methyltransferase involved in polyketide biosynthesis